MVLNNIKLKCRANDGAKPWCFQCLNRELQRDMHSLKSQRSEVKIIPLCTLRSSEGENRQFLGIKDKVLRKFRSAENISREDIQEQAGKIRSVVELQGCPARRTPRSKLARDKGKYRICAGHGPSFPMLERKNTPECPCIPAETPAPK